MSGGAGGRVAGDPQLAARVAAGRLEDVPAGALAGGLGLPLHDFLGIELVGLRPVVVELALGEGARTLGAPLHGGAAATLADVAGNVAIATSGSVDVTRYGLVTIHLEVELRAQPEGDRVRAVAEAGEVSRRAAEARCRIEDASGRRIADALVRSRLVPRAGVAASDARAER